MSGAIRVAAASVLVASFLAAPVHGAITVMADWAAGIGCGSGPVPVPGPDNTGDVFWLTPNSANPPHWSAVMEFGRVYGGEMRGVARFDLSATTDLASSAVLSFRVKDFSPIMGVPPQLHGLEVVAYIPTEPSIVLSEFQLPSTQTIGQFGMFGNYSIGDIYTVDATSFYNSMRGSEVGIRVQLTEDPGTANRRTAQFHDMRLEIQAAVAPVPEPSTLLIWLGLSGIGLLAARRRRRRAG